LKFYEYLEHAPGAELKGDAAQRKYTIKEEAKGGWWKHCLSTT
jgi:hypothetical protein